MRSLHVITSTARRGAETFAVQLCERLGSRADHTAEIVALTPASGDTLDVEALGTTRRSPVMLRALHRRARDFDVVVAHGSSTLEACACALIRASPPFVFRTIGDPRYWLTSAAKRHVVSRLLQRASAHVVLWDRAADDLVALHGIDRDRIFVIPNAVDSRLFPPASREDRQRARSQLGIDEDTRVIAVVGALSPEKNPQAIFDAASRLPETTFLVVGDGPSRSAFAEVAATCSNLHLLGTVNDPFPVYAAADLLLLASLSEGMPGVVIEAGMVGTPIVATPVGALPTMLGGGRGILATSSRPEAVSEACEAALNERPVAVPQHWRDYDIQPIADTWATLLERTSSTRQRR